jgi:chaperonin GroEL (HSP60 family)
VAYWIFDCNVGDIKLENVQIEDLRRAKKITRDKDNTTIIQGAGKCSEIEARIRKLRAQIEESTSDYDGEEMQEQGPSTSTTRIFAGFRSR